MLNEGWVKLHRKIAKWEWWTDTNTAHLFIHLLLSANREPRRWRGVEVGAGQLITGRNSLSIDTGISHQSIRTSLEKLKSTGEITSKSTNRWTLITICKWDTYQNGAQQPSQQTNQQVTNNQPTGNQQVTTNKNVRSREVKETKRPFVVGSADLPFPPAFDNPEFRQIWAEWEQHRIEKKCALTPRAARMCLQRLAQHPQATAIAMLQRSIMNGWQGIFDLPAKEQHATAKPHNPRNDFTCTPTIPYAEIARRRQEREREREKLRLEQKMAQNANQPPSEAAGS